MDVEFQKIDEAELTNDIVTVSKLQIALRAEARRLQALLNEWGVNTDTAKPDSLFELLQQVAIALLDYSRCWTHVLASSQTVNSREEAELRYAQLSSQERSKFTETLTNVNGVIGQQAIALDRDGEKAAYIVVTLLLGTVDDQPLFGEIYSASGLRDVLDDIRMMRPRYLMALEVLWSPQDASDNLTEEELAVQYGDLVAIA